MGIRDSIRTLKPPEIELQTAVSRGDMALAVAVAGNTLCCTAGSAHH
jgi:hypothetical protein